MITSVASPDTERRVRTRNLAGISTQSYDDTALDIKIEAADAYVTLLFGSVPTDAARLEAFITASNLYASVLICSGIDGPEIDARIRDQKMQINDLVKAAHGLQESQHKPQIRKTPGASSMSYGFGQ